MASTMYFKNYTEFYNRTDQSLNGTSDPSKVSMESSNIGCWNCDNCTNCRWCTNCDNCTDCNNCDFCNNTADLNCGMLYNGDPNVVAMTWL